jgi:CheY-like chemotaxis protein
VLPKVIWADDDPDLRKAISRQFPDVHVVSSGAEAIEHLAHRSAIDPYHVLVTDERMPGIRGVDVCRQALKISPLTWRVIVTGYPTHIPGYSTGVVDVELAQYLFSKPFDANAIGAVLAELTSRRPHSGVLPAVTDERAREVVARGNALIADLYKVAGETKKP